jgi:ABC-type transport system involved in multi-copper enzyme maturation permease subunit
MLWYQAWIETRWRFVVALCVLSVVVCGTVYDYLAVLKLAPVGGALDSTGITGRLRDAIEVQRTFRGFIWMQWFRQNLSQTGTLVAALLGCGTVLSRGSEGSVLFTLSLPVARPRILGIRATMGLAEWFVLALVPSLLVPLVAPAIGQHYGIADVLRHGLSVFVAGTVFYSAATLLSTVFADIWRPLLLTCVAAAVLATAESIIPSDAFGIFRIMSGERYFLTGAMPWLGLLICALLAGALLYASVRNLERRDF